jgi:hypothetical protein
VSRIGTAWLGVARQAWIGRAGIGMEWNGMVRWDLERQARRDQVRHGVERRVPESKGKAGVARRVRERCGWIGWEWIGRHGERRSARSIGSE